MSTDAALAGLIVVFSIVVLGQLLLRNGPFPWTGATILAASSSIVAMASLAMFHFGAAKTPLPEVDLNRLNAADAEALKSQRDEALHKLGQRKLIKVRQANKASARPLGSLVTAESPDRTG